MLQAGGLLMLFVVVCVIVLLCLLVPVKVLLWIAGGLLALVALTIAVCHLIPFDPEKIIGEHAGDVIEESDRRLLDLALDKNLKQADLYRFAKDWDIEDAPLMSVLLMAYLMKTRPDLKFPQVILPRLNGVLSFCRFQNLKREAHFSKVGNALAAEGIPFAILKGGAMKVYRPDFPRWMNDVDMLVRESDYGRAVDIAISLGYDKPMATDHSVDLHLPGSEEGLLDIHQRLEMFTGCEDVLNEGILARAGETKIFSTCGLLPCPEDMVFISLVNLFKNIAKKQTPESTLTAFYDIKYLLDSKPGFDIDVVKEDARLTGGGFQILYASKVVEAVVPGLLPEGWTDSFDVPEKEFRKCLVDVLFQRDVMSGARDAMMGTSLGESLEKDWNLLVFMWVACVEIVRKVLGARVLRYPVWRIYRLFN